MSRSLVWRGKRKRFDSFSALARAHAYGRLWYHESGQALDAYADGIGVPFGYACDVLAILSPRVSVEQNAKLARSYLETGSAPGAMSQRLEALARYETSGLFNGPKVNAFSAALQGDGDAIVIDAWMLRLFNAELGKVGSYERVAQRVRMVARSLGWQGAETQAALWCGARALCGFGDTYSPVRI